MHLLFALLLTVSAAFAADRPYDGAIYQTFGVVPPTWDPSQHNDRTDDAWLYLALGDHEEALKSVAGASEDISSAASEGAIDAGTASVLAAQHDYIEQCAGKMARYWAAVEAKDYGKAQSVARSIRSELPPSRQAPSLYLKAVRVQIDQLNDVARRLVEVDRDRDDASWREAMDGAWKLTDDVGEMWTLWRMTDEQLALIEEQMGAVYTRGDEVLNPNPLLGLRN